MGISYGSSNTEVHKHEGHLALSGLGLLESGRAGGGGDLHPNWAGRGQECCWLFCYAWMATTRESYRPQLSAPPRQQTWLQLSSCMNMWFFRLWELVCLKGLFFVAMDLRWSTARHILQGLTRLQRAFWTLKSQRKQKTETCTCHLLSFLPSGRSYNFISQTVLKKFSPKDIFEKPKDSFFPINTKSRKIINLHCKN